MSVLIKTMTDLPEHCYDCPCHDGESSHCQADKEHRYSFDRPFWCPLVKISNEKTGHWIYKQYDGYQECGDYHCSECDKIDNRTPAYCPHCGCAMVEEINNDI